MSLGPGQMLSRYRLVKKIGEGGMGVVWKARDENLRRDVALKVLPSQLVADANHRRRLINEARAAAAINHPNVGTVYEVDEADGTVFIAMELIEGCTLRSMLDGDPMEVPEFLRLATAIAEGLADAHGVKVIHRDLKPENILIRPDGHVKIVDFGLARIYADAEAHASSSTRAETLTKAITRDGRLLGTPAYMSPEQVRGELLDPRSDVFSLGVVLYEMAAGERPFPGESTMEVLSSILRDAAPPLSHRRPGLPRRLDQVIGRCLEKTLPDRYPTAREVCGELRGLDLELRSGTAAVGRPRPQKSVVVLPFTDMSPGQDQEYFCDGISEEIITTLARIRGLRVISRLSAFRYKGAETDSRSIGGQLDVTHLLQGSVRKSGDRLRITVQLIDAQEDSHVWTERYDRSLEDVFSIQEDIAQSTTQALKIALTSEESRALGRAPTTKVAAYDLYLRGREFFHRATARDHEFARQMFSRAIEIDPLFTRAYAGLADTISYIYKHFDHDERLLDEADAASARALELDSELPEAHTSRGVVHWLKGRDDAADRQFEAAIRLDPGLFEAHYLYGVACFVRGLFEKAARLFQQASEVRPGDYQSLINRGVVLRGLGREVDAVAAYEKGLAVARQHLEFHPDDVRAWYMAAGALVATGDVESGLEWARKVERMAPDNSLAHENLAGIYAGAGRIDKGLDCIERAVQLGFRHRSSLENDPDLAPLRSHPRFRKLLQRL